MNTEEFFDPLKKKERWHCEKHNVIIAGLDRDCPLCASERKYIHAKMETPHRKRWKWRSKRERESASQSIGTPIKMIHMIDQSLSI